MSRVDEHDLDEVVEVSVKGQDTDESKLTSGEAIVLLRFKPTGAVLAFTPPEAEKLVHKLTKAAGEARVQNTEAEDADGS